MACTTEAVERRAGHSRLRIALILCAIMLCAAFFTCAGNSEDAYAGDYLLKVNRQENVVTAYAKDSANVTVRIGSYSTYDTEAFQKHVTMEPIWRSYEFENTALVDDLFARLEFNLGKNQTKYQFKDVKIYRID